MKQVQISLDKLLGQYRLWGIIAMVAFTMLVIFLLHLQFVRDAGIFSTFIVLVFGFLWIGATSICRHSFITIKERIGKKVGVIEFLSTQIIVLLFPFAYRRLKEEIKDHRKQLDAVLEG